MRPKIRVSPPEDIADLIPSYLAACQLHLETAKRALGPADFPAIQSAGHKMKGTGASYGFEIITILGAALEAAAERHDPAEIRKVCDELADYLARAEIAGPNQASGQVSAGLPVRWRR